MSLMYVQKSLIGIVTMMLALSLAACGGGKSAEEPAPAPVDDEASAETTAAETAAPAVPMNDAEIADWLQGTPGYEGREATISGQIFHQETKENRCFYQIQTDPVNHTGNTVVYIENENPGFEDGAYIQATGLVEEPAVIKGEKGDEVSTTCLRAAAIDELSYIDAVSPTIAAVDANVTVEDQGCSVTIRNIEFASTETRVYVSVTNGSPHSVLVYDFNSTVTQGGTKFEYQSNMEAGYPSINRELHEGDTVEGILCFPPLNAADMQIHLEGTADGAEKEELTFDFNILF